MRLKYITLSLIISLLLVSCDGKSGRSITSPSSNVNSTSSTATPSPILKTGKESTSAEDSQSASPTENDSLKNAELNIRVAAIDEGFRVQFAPEYQAVMMMPFLESPNGKEIVAQIRRMATSGNSGVWYRRDAIVIDPDSKTVRTFPLMNAWTPDDYSTDSVAGIAGFLDDDTILYVSLHGEEGGSATYNIETLNIHTGENKVLFENQLDNVAPDFYEQVLNSSKDMLFVNSFSKGLAWVYDLKNRSSKLLERRFPNHWPMWGLSRSPDGHRFWYAGQLFDAGGTPVAHLEKSKFGGSLFWSPNSRYTIYQYNVDDSEENWMDGGESGILAPQAIKVLDQDGKVLHTLKPEQSTMHVELGGWPSEPDWALLRYYRVDRSQPSEKQKVDNEYAIYNLQSGEIRKLKPVTLEKLNHPESISGGLPFLVDWENSTYWISEQREDFMGELQDGTFVWRKDDYTNTSSVLYFFTPGHERTVQFQASEIIGSSLYLNRWIVSNVFVKQTLTFLDADIIRKGSSARHDKPH